MTRAVTRAKIIGALFMIGALAALTLLVPRGALASPKGDLFVTDLLSEIREALERAALDRAPTPPVAVALKWRTKKRGSFELDAPLLALETSNLDGAIGEELIALTTAEVVVFAMSPRPAIVARAPLPSSAAVIRSRDPVGVISLERDGVFAVRTSEQANGARYRMTEGVLVIVGELTPAHGFPLCDGINADLEVGKNQFDPASLVVANKRWPSELPRPTKPFYGIECRSIVGVDGRINRTVAVTGPEREVLVGCMRGDQPCPADAVSPADVSAAGVAFEIADLNRDGRAETMSSLGKAPGDTDRIRVFGLDGKRLKSKNLAVGVAAISAVDVEGDGRRHLYFAARGHGSKRITLWTLNRHP